MNRHWVTLEYPVIVKRLAGYTDFSGGRALALALTPAPDIREARERLALTTEARALILARADFALGGIHDIRPLAERAEHGVTLQSGDLLRVRDTLLGAARVHRILTRLESQFPGLADIAWRIHPLPALTEAIAQVLDERGEVRDSASPELARIRRELHNTQDRVQERLRRMLTAPDVARYLQETLITRREGRFVIPVQADFRGQVQGIVHDRSSSGATLFMEPVQVVELNNALRELQLAEEDEVLRLLRELTAEVGDAALQIDVSLEALAELDMTLAKARYAEEIDACAPELRPIPEAIPAPESDNAHPGTVVRLQGARHPLLHPETVVPVDLVMDEDTHVLVITGPNTGGKTVSLKTMGLLTLMAQAGMHIPANPGAVLSFFEPVVADIGDEQSIEQSLSTFSAHLTNIIEFLSHVDHRALVLMDELGAGTDPAEGNALARSLLDTFRCRRCTVLVATHYPELKLYAHATPGVRNASMQFDVETLAPTYRLTIGVPGRSNAFAIARRLGLPEAIIKDARKMVSQEDLRADDMLEDLHNLRIQEVHARDGARRERREAESLTEELRQRLSGIEEERREILRQAEAEAHEAIEALQAEVRALRQKLLATPLREASPAFDAVAEAASALESPIAEPEPLVEALAAAPEEAPQGPLAVGDTVRLASLNMQGTILDLEDDEAVIQAGALRTRVDQSDLELVHRARPSQPESAKVSVPLRSPSPGIEIDLRGHTVDEALTRLDRYLDDAAMASLPWVRIIHGKGSGTLRREVRRFMNDHPLVTSYKSAARTEGGEGATVAKLIQTAR